MKNERVKAVLNQNSMKQWQLADLMGISEQSLSKKFRYELPEDEQQRIITLIEENAGAYHAGTEE